MEYLFEKYIDFNNDKVFLGYKRVIAENRDQALVQAKEKEDEKVMFVPIANPASF